MVRCRIDITIVTLALLLAASPSSTERNLVPSLERSFDVLRQAYQQVLVQDIYRAQSHERIVKTGDCDCKTRFLSWDAAEAVFRERHESDERWETLQATDGYNRRANIDRAAAQAICDATGNW